MRYYISISHNAYHHLLAQNTNVGFLDNNLHLRGTDAVGSPFTRGNAN